jgi:hypothetical protein
MRARRRYLAVDPDNRLVADTLEADWNHAPGALQAAQDGYSSRIWVSRFSSSWALAVAVRASRMTIDLRDGSTVQTFSVVRGAGVFCQR